jgi:hypothetical protein
MFHRVGSIGFLYGVLAASYALAAPAGVPPLPAPQADEAVSVYLRPNVTLGGPVVTVGDVAALEGGFTAYRQWLAALDLAELSAATPDLNISQEQVAFRLRLAGARVNQFQLLGAKQTQAHRAESVSTETPAVSVVKQAAAVEPKPPENPVIIKPRDQIHLLVRVGPLRLTTLCEAVQEGRAGQMIRVRNVDSRVERVGRVVDRNTVELEQEGTTP